MNDVKPLSIAVFGPPGSGKSSAIKQLSGELFERGQEVLEFNLTQMETRQELHQAFHRVRDASVKQVIPLVFWDEFDTGKLKWLKDFLAPMQDAEFVSGGIAHPFGKAIFVFAGGTSFTYEDFDKTRASGTEAREFAELKGPDFVSRLRGYVNIKGPNPTPSARGPASEEAKQADVAHLIRRAIILRTVIKRFCSSLVDSENGRASVSASVIRGFLRAEKFYHGARSMESIVKMSTLGGMEVYGAAALPSDELLSLHVTPDFMEQVKKGELEVETVEALARAFHYYYQQAKPGVVRVEYSDLSEEYKERNRVTARVTFAKCSDIGYGVVTCSREEKQNSDPDGFTDEEVMRLTRIEHEIWMRDHCVQGYDYAEKRDDSVLLHNCIAHFEDLTEEYQRIDRVFAEMTPGMLWQENYKLTRATSAPERIRIGVTGHRILTDIDKLIAGVEDALDKIESAYGGANITVLSSLAEGADRIVADAVLRRKGSELMAVLPFDQCDYVEDFGPEGAASRTEFHRLLACASDVLTLHKPSSLEEGYENAGRYVLEHCDILLAIWDGQGAQGQGGTGEIVARASEQGKPVVIVRAGNRKPGTDEPTTLGEEQGIVLVEGLPWHTTSS